MVNKTKYSIQNHLACLVCVCDVVFVDFVVFDDDFLVFADFVFSDTAPVPKENVKSAKTRKSSSKTTKPTKTTSQTHQKSSVGVNFVRFRLIFVDHRLL